MPFFSSATDPSTAVIAWSNVDSHCLTDYFIVSIFSKLGGRARAADAATAAFSARHDCERKKDFKMEKDLFRS